VWVEMNENVGSPVDEKYKICDFFLILGVHFMS
jgi:hypothetical protein